MGLLTDNGMYRDQMREAFAACVTEYANLRGYIADRYDDQEPDVIAWLKGKGVVAVEGVAEADRWYEQFQEGWNGLADLIRKEEEFSGEIIDGQYDDALADGEPWAVEAHETRHGGRTQ